MPHILTIKNSSNYLKYQLFDKNEEELTSGCLTEIKDYQQAAKQVLRNIKDLQEIFAVGHYVAYGGQEFIKPIKIDQGVRERIEEISEGVDSDNAYNLIGIRAFQEYLNLPQVAVFDSAFFADVPGNASQGIHGLSHQGALISAIEKLKKRPVEINIISCHLAESCSVAGIKKGKPVDVSASFVLSENIKNEQDFLVLLREATFKREAKLIIEEFVYKIKKLIGAAYAALDGDIKAVVLTGFIINSQPAVRNKIIQSLKFLGKRVKVLTVEDKEGLLIAKEAEKLMVKFKN